MFCVTFPITRLVLLGNFFHGELSGIPANLTLVGGGGLVRGTNPKWPNQNSGLESKRICPNVSKSTLARWWQQINISLFSTLPTWGRFFQFDEHIFQMGWFNHQLARI